MPNDSKLSKSHLDHFVQEIESTEGPLGPTFRTLFDNDDYKVFMDLLQARIKTLDKDIERLCSHYYQGFTDSIHELPHIRNDMEKFKNDITSTNVEVQTSGTVLLGKVQDMVKYERIEGNIETSVNSVKICIPVLATYLKLQQQLKDKRYYAALKTLEILEKHHLPRVSTFEFVKQLRSSVAGVRENIKMASIAELKDFLESVRKKSTLLGAEAMRNQGLTAQVFDLGSVLNRLRERREKVSAHGPVKDLRPGHDSGRAVGGNPFDPTPPDQLERDAALAYRIMYQGIDPSEYVDFSPVYRCLHINTILNNQEGFVDYYRKQRQKQIRLVLQPPQSQANESLDTYKAYLNDVAGFFIVEDHIMTTTRKSDLVSKPFLEDLWETSSSKSIALLKTRSAYCTDSVLILELKNLIVLFCLTMKEYGFTIARIYDLLLEIRQQYHEITRMQMVQLFHQTLAQDSYAPLVALDTRAYAELVSKINFYDGPKADQITFPYVFPFSASLSILLDHIKVYIQTCLTFSTDLPNLSATEIDDSIRKSVVNLLTRSLSGCISALLKRSDLNTAQFIQVAINLQYLERAMPMLDEYISRFTRATSQGTRISGLHSKNIMKEIREETEIRVKQEISHNLINALKSAKFDWTANSVSSQPGPFALQIKDYIENSLLAYPNTTEHTYQKCLDATFEFMGQSLLGILVSDRVRTISLPALQTFQLNLNYLLDNFQKNVSRDKGLKSLDLFRHFSELNQLLNLLLKLDWSTYINEYGRNNDSNYSRVSSRLAASMLEKLMLGEKQRENVLTNITKKNERKKLNETVLKQLKQMNGTE